MERTFASRAASVFRHPRFTSIVNASGDVLTCDHSGRLILCDWKGRVIVRGLSGIMKQKGWGERGDIFDRRISELKDAARASLLEQIQRDLVREIEAGSSASVRKTLEDIISRISELKQDERRFHEIYKPIPILPPDHYFPIVLQITEGCPWNRCTFCSFYRDRSFRMKGADEIRRHMEDVKSFLAEGASLRDSIFLADANTLVLKTSLLIGALKHARQQFPEQMNDRRGAFAFADVPAILGKSPSELTELREAGLRGVYVGFESGSDPIRRRIKKPASADDAVQSMQRIQEAGLSLGVIVLLGLGGREEEMEHVQQTIRALRRVRFGRKDILFFSPFYPTPASDYTDEARNAGWTALNVDGLREQYKRLVEGLGKPALASTRYGLYHVQESLY